MAIIYSYPTATPQAGNYLLGTQYDVATEENKTVQFTIGDVNSLATENYLETTVTLTKAQLAALQNTDVTLIPAQGANKYIKILAVSVFLDYTAPAFTFASSIRLEINNITMCVIPNTIGQSAADTVFTATLSEGIIAENTALIIGTSGAVGNNGGSSMQVKVRYQILDKTAFLKIIYGNNIYLPYCFSRGFRYIIGN